MGYPLRKFKASDRPLGEQTQLVVNCRFEHPEWNQKQIAEHLGVRQDRVSRILNNKRVVAAYPLLARQKIRSMVPKAVKRFGELMEQTENLEVSRKVTERVLETEKVLENAPSVQVNVFQTMQETELKQILEGKTIRPDAIDAELVQPDPPPPPQSA